MNIQVHMKICRSCLKSPEAAKLIDFTSESAEILFYYTFLDIQVNLFSITKSWCFSLVLQNSCVEIIRI